MPAQPWRECSTTVAVTAEGTAVDGRASNELGRCRPGSHGLGRSVTWSVGRSVRIGDGLAEHGREPQAVAEPIGKLLSLRNTFVCCCQSPSRHKIQTQTRVNVLQMCVLVSLAAVRQPCPDCSSFDSRKKNSFLTLAKTRAFRLANYVFGLLSNLTVQAPCSVRSLQVYWLSVLPVNEPLPHNHRTTELQVAALPLPTWRPSWIESICSPRSREVRGWRQEQQPEIVQQRRPPVRPRCRLKLLVSGQAFSKIKHEFLGCARVSDFCGRQGPSHHNLTDTSTPVICRDERLSTQ
ncbi:hypothetical protein BCV70DRAFT_12139 [Testicularia cyperi]|uniref:Uncharacterized protein n=1 Tax=Testicularia cyperi TaxID=1882483 RepID=A0A317Y0I1_9BASI|nr:hypothetical protein BCV70DRAFT_12139 [Testicularia cyperi]